MNVKDQGRLLRQDNFIVWNGKKKTHRRVFLLDDLVIFSKVKKQPGVVDLFYYKNSLKVLFRVIFCVNVFLASDLVKTNQTEIQSE